MTEDSWLNLDFGYDVKSLLDIPLFAFGSYANTLINLSESSQPVREENFSNLYVSIQESDIHKLNVLYLCPKRKENRSNRTWLISC